MSSYCRVNTPTWKQIHGRKARIHEVGPNTVKVFVLGPNFYALLRKDQIEDEDSNKQRSDNRTDNQNRTPIQHVRGSSYYEVISIALRGIESRLEALEHRSNSRPKRKRKDAATK